MILQIILLQYYEVQRLEDDVYKYLLIQNNLLNVKHMMCASRCEVKIKNRRWMQKMGYP